MPKTAVTQYDVVAANNTDLAGILLTDSGAVANGNDVFQNMMAHIAAMVAAPVFGAVMSLVSLDPGAVAAPILDLYRNSASPAAPDEMGQISFNGNNSVGTKKLYAYITAQIADPVNGTEDGNMNFGNIVNGVGTLQGSITATGWNGLNIGATTRGTGAFTTLAANGAFSLTGDQVQVSEGGTGVSTFTAGLLVGNGASALISRTLTGPAAGIAVTNGTGVAGNPTLALANDLSALEALASTGIAVRTTTDTWAQRTITGTASEITVSNGDGVSGNPTLFLPTSLAFGGKTITGGAFSGPAITGASVDSTPVGATTPSTGVFTTLRANNSPMVVRNSASSSIGPSYLQFATSNGTQLGYVGVGDPSGDVDLYAAAGGVARIWGANTLGLTLNATTVTSALPIRAPAGSATAVAVGVAAGYGIYFPSSTNVAIAAGGASYMALFGSGGVTINDGIPFSFDVGSTGAIFQVGLFSAVGGGNGKRITSSTFQISVNTTSGVKHQQFFNPNGEVGSISTSASSTAFTTSSDENLKNFIGVYDPAEAIRIIRADPVRDFTWKRSGDYAIGWGAQTSFKISPDLAVPGYGLPGELNFSPWGVDQSKRTPYLWAATGWLLDKVDFVGSILDDHETRIAALEATIH